MPGAKARVFAGALDVGLKPHSNPNSNSNSSGNGNDSGGC
ncbi:hypothetical protein AciX9_1423 [Granulicella tundricola MP5ACTX9]|uniref:Uncharacterized protein n=1 Tax=Granulicella tundricola (strain ATCC BAA-1859 / DSM 23138 / MP5ACTX9) TaxID=1198114 RepID=E8WW98_GRATM|nr:hypothetical protein AciX9_1423 [Granulicella tundricola MP5ACTX9]